MIWSWFLQWYSVVCISQTYIILSSQLYDLFFSQWSDAMLSNLLYCQGRVTGSGSTSDLEAEWKKLYPASLLTARLTSNIALSLKHRINKMDIIGSDHHLLILFSLKCQMTILWRTKVQMISCRNLKSRLTVYQRTHAERSAPRQPMQVLYLFIDDASLSQHRQRQIKDQDNHDGNTGEGLPGSCATCEDEILSSGFSPPCKDWAGAVCQWKPSSSKGGEGCEGRAALDRCNGARHVWLSGPGIEIIIIIATIDMVMTITNVTMIKHSQAREELDTTTSREVNPRWLKLWLNRHPNRWSLVFLLFLSF